MPGSAVECDELGPEVLSVEIGAGHGASVGDRGEGAELAMEVSSGNVWPLSFILIFFFSVIKISLLWSKRNKPIAVHFWTKILLSMKDINQGETFIICKVFNDNFSLSIYVYILFFIVRYFTLHQKLDYFSLIHLRWELLQGDSCELITVPG